MKGEGHDVKSLGKRYSAETAVVRMPGRHRPLLLSPGVRPFGGPATGERWALGANGRQPHPGAHDSPGN